MIDFEREWDILKNPEADFQQLKLLMNKEYHWICDKGHEWKSSMYMKMRGMGCPTCIKEKNSNILAYNNPTLIKEWNYKKNNEITPFNVSIGSNKRVWWVCGKCGVEWEASVYHRNKGTGCPYCAGKRAGLDNCLATLNPELAKEWHPTKNRDLTPYDVTPGSAKKVWWSCENGHEWEAGLSARVRRGTGCPYCAGKRTGLNNCLATINPELAKQWHPTKNEDLTPYDVTPGSHIKVWWQCENGHEWIARVGGRTQGNNCRICISKTRKKGGERN